VIEVAASPAHSGERRRATGKYYALERPGEHAPNNYRDFAMLSFTARAATYTISSYPAGLAEVSCDAFKKNADGSWTQVAILIAGAPLSRPAAISRTRPRPALSRRSATRNRNLRPSDIHAQISLGAPKHLALGGVPSAARDMRKREPLGLRSRLLHKNQRPSVSFPS
jgi:hypothetical protein